MISLSTYLSYAYGGYVVKEIEEVEEELLIFLMGLSLYLFLFLSSSYNRRRVSADTRRRLDEEEDGNRDKSLNNDFFPSFHNQLSITAYFLVEEEILCGN